MPKRTFCWGTSNHWGSHEGSIRLHPTFRQRRRSMGASVFKAGPSSTYALPEDQVLAQNLLGRYVVFSISWQRQKLRARRLRISSLPSKSGRTRTTSSRAASHSQMACPLPEGSSFEEAMPGLGRVGTCLYRVGASWSSVRQNCHRIPLREPQKCTKRRSRSSRDLGVML